MKNRLLLTILVAFLFINEQFVYSVNNNSKSILLKSDLDDEVADDFELDGARPCTTKWSVNHVKLTVQWNPGVCFAGNLSCASKAKNKFSIHGLWPQGDRAEFCCYYGSSTSGQSFDNKRYYKDMIKNWSSLTSMRSELLWGHEWKKHGTCASKVGLNSEDDYFKFVLKKFESLELDLNLKLWNIYPGNEVDSDKLQRALSNNHGAQVSLVCGNIFSILTEVYFCYDQSLKPVDCRRKVVNCSNVIKIASAR